MNQRNDAAGRSKASAGFTFIEVLIVMGIIATLVGLSVVVIQLMASKGPEMRTAGLVNKTSAYVTQWRQSFETHPPSRMQDLPRFMDAVPSIKGSVSPENEGIETLYQALLGKGSRVGAEFTEEEIANLDEDELDEPISSDGNAKLYELVDAYGNPLVYMSARDYARYERTPMRITLGMPGRDGEVVDVRPWRNEETGAFAQQDTYQLFSLGEDAEPHTDDDIKYWDQ